MSTLEASLLLLCLLYFIPRFPTNNNEPEFNDIYWFSRLAATVALHMHYYVMHTNIYSVLLRIAFTYIY